MRPLVADASAGLAVLLGEPGEQQVARTLDARDVVLVPWFFWLEITNVLARRHRWPARQIMSAIYDLEQLGLRTEPSSRPAMMAVIDAVESHALTAYDATYLVLAEAADADLLTVDAFLAAAAGERAILVGRPRRLPERAARHHSSARERDIDWPGAAAYLDELRREAEADLAAVRLAQERRPH